MRTDLHVDMRTGMCADMYIDICHRNAFLPLKITSDRRELTEGSGALKPEERAGSVCACL